MVLIPEWTQSELIQDEKCVCNEKINKQVSHGTFLMHMNVGRQQRYQIQTKSTRKIDDKSFK